MNLPVIKYMYVYMHLCMCRRLRESHAAVEEKANKLNSTFSTGQITKVTTSLLLYINILFSSILCNEL